MLLAAMLAWSIQQANPALQSGVARQYARLVVKEAQEHKLDPWLLEAIGYKESRWITSAIGYEKDGSCWVGLGQVRVQDCEEERVKVLLVPEANLHAASMVLVDARNICARSGKKCRTSKWLGLYNPGDKGYAASVMKLAKEHRAYASHHAKPSVRDIQARVHASRM